MTCLVRVAARVRVRVRVRIGARVRVRVRVRAGARGRAGPGLGLGLPVTASIRSDESSCREPSANGKGPIAARHSPPALHWRMSDGRVPVVGAVRPGEG